MEDNELCLTQRRNDTEVGAARTPTFSVASCLRVRLFWFRPRAQARGRAAFIRVHLWFLLLYGIQAVLSGGFSLTPSRRSFMMLMQLRD